MNVREAKQGWPKLRAAGSGEYADVVQTARPWRTANVAGWIASVLAHAIAFALLASRSGATQSDEPTVIPPVIPPIAIEVMTPAQPTQPARPPVMHAPVATAIPRPPPVSAASNPAARDTASAQQAAVAEASPATAPTSVPAAPSPQPPEPPVTAPIGNAAYLHNPAPRYPQAAQEEGWEGRVVLRVHVDASGHPTVVELHTSSSHEVLDKAALAAVRQWAFVPAKRGSTPTDGWVDVPLDFRLN